MDNSHETTGCFEKTERGAHGWMTKQGYRVKNWKKRFFILDNSILTYSQLPTDSEPRGIIHLGIHKAVKQTGLFEGKSRYMFDLQTPKRTYHIIVEDEQSLNKWVELINSKMEMNAESILSDASDAKKKSSDIDKQLQKEGRTKLKEVKLLLLGTGESGKSTIFKQMKILQNNGGYSQEELMSYRTIIFANCITQMKVLIKAAQKLNFPPDNPELEERVQHILSLPAGGECWDEAVGQSILQLWASQFLKETYKLRDKEFHLNDTASYFFENVLRFSNPSYIPSEQDVLRARVRSTGIEEAEFKFDNLEFRMLDVGGQRSERRKWIHCFDCVTAVIFCAGISEYDQTLREDETQNRIHESLLLFEEICNMAWFRETAFILFLNKIDLFKDKITRVDLSTCFSEYTGGGDFEAASNFMKNKFLEQNTSPHVIFTHFTCAISTENVAYVFSCVRETILKNILSDIF